MSQFQHKNALITGGASGIGKLMGKLLLQKGLNTLVIWDNNAALLRATVKELSLPGLRVFSYVVDITDTGAIITAAAQVTKDVGKINILINNAGIVVGKPFVEHSHDEIDRTMRINSSALMHIAALFLPAMIEAKQGHIVNIASAAGLISNPRMSVYVASKWAVAGWSDSLWLEMKVLNAGVRVSTVTPYYINTGMFDGVKSTTIPILDAGVAARRIIRGIENNKRFIRMPGIVYILPFVKGILPAGWFDVIVGKWMGVYKTMDDFKGRQ